MTNTEELAGSMIMDFVTTTITTWFANDVEFVALSNRLPVETFTEGDPPCRVQSARLRGLEVLHLNDDMAKLADALVYTFNDACAEGLAEVQAQGFALLPRARGMA